MTSGRAGWSFNWNHSRWDICLFLPHMDLGYMPEVRFKIATCLIAWCNLELYLKCWWQNSVVNSNPTAVFGLLLLMECHYQQLRHNSMTLIRCNNTSYERVIWGKACHCKMPGRARVYRMVFTWYAWWNLIHFHWEVAFLICCGLLSNKQKDYKFYIHYLALYSKW